MLKPVTLLFNNKDKHNVMITSVAADKHIDTPVLIAKDKLFNYESRLLSNRSPGKE